ncbi:MAG: hypothetical protein ACOYH0_05665 [Saccharofermentanales bacterium]|jgi:hypothetical protein
MSSIKKIKEMLRNYSANAIRMKMLEQEMKRFIPITANEVLEMLTFSGKTGDEVPVQKERSTNRVFHIATSYRRLAWLINYKAEKEMTEEYQKAAKEVEFIRYAIRALPKYYRDLMTYDVLEGKRWSEVCDHFSLSGVEFSRKKERAICRMAKIFEKQYRYFGFKEEDICDRD